MALLCVNCAAACSSAYDMALLCVSCAAACSSAYDMALLCVSCAFVGLNANNKTAREVHALK